MKKTISIETRHHFAFTDKELEGKTFREQEYYMGEQARKQLESEGELIRKARTECHVGYSNSPNTSYYTITLKS
jgi:hypothetical protein